MKSYLFSHIIESDPSWGLSRRHDFLPKAFCTYIVVCTFQLHLLMSIDRQLFECKVHSSTVSMKPRVSEGLGQTETAGATKAMLEETGGGGISLVSVVTV